MQPFIATTNVIVANGQSLSGESVDLVRNAIVGFVMPAAIDSATSITFQAAGMEGTYLNVYDDAGSELAVTVGVDRHIPIDPSSFASLRFVKVRLGTSGTPVSATADRIIGIVVRPIAA